MQLTATFCPNSCVGQHYSKFLRIMRITAILLLTAGLTASAGSKSQTVNLSVKNAELTKVFAAIESQTDYVFFYNYNLLKDAKKVTVEIKNTSLQDALKILFDSQPFDYVIREKTIVLTTKSSPSKSADVTEAILNSSIDITGRITNTQGEPLSGANVIIKRKAKGTITDSDGNFILKDVESEDVLTISFVGYKTISIKVGEITKFTIIMETATNKLDEIVVQAYGTTTDRLRTGNITTVTAKEIEIHPVMNVLQALQGKVPGLEVVQSSGYSSAPYKVEIRGRKFLNQNLAPDPLIIIDGVPLTVLNLTNDASANGSPGFIQNGFTGPAKGQSPLFSINPTDIESVTVLKDADATAIYGSRGGSGVILITTKKGKAGKTQFDANVYTGFIKIPRYYDMMNTQQYLTMRREAIENDGYTQYLSDPIFNSLWPDLTIWDTTRYTNWQKYLWGGTGITNDVNLSISGGNASTTFRISTAYHNEKDVLAVSGSNQRGTLQSSIVHRNTNNRLNISYSTIISYAQVDQIAYDPNLVQLPPNAPPVYDSIGHLNYKGYAPASGLFGFGSLKVPYSSKTFFLNNNLNIKYEILKGLVVSTSLGSSNNRIKQFQSTPIVSQDPLSNPKGSAAFGNNNGDRWIIEPQVEFEHFIQKLRFNAIVGGTIQKVSQDGNTIIGRGYIDDNLLRSISNATTKNAGDISGQYRYAAVFSRLSLNYGGKYLLNLSARRDGSSRFGAGKQFGNFGAIGIGWIFSEEDLIKKSLPFLSFGKIRASYGVSGSDNLGDYNYLTRWTASSSQIDPYLGQVAYLTTQHANPNLQWQENKKLELGLHLAFLQDKLSFEFSYYRDRCGNQLVDYILPAITGFSSVSANSPANVENSGFECILRSTIINSKNLVWTVNFNLSVNKNKLLSYPNLENSPYASYYILGQPLNIAQLLHYTGVDPQSGLYTFEDTDKDGTINFTGAKNDLYPTDLNTKYEGAFGSDLSFHGFTASFLMTFQRRPSVRSAIYNSSITPGAFGLGNQSVQMLNRWQKPGDIATVQKYSTQLAPTDTYFSISDGLFSNGSFLRLANVSLSYNFRLSGKNTKNNLKIYLRGENLFLITNYNGIDPLTPSFGALPVPRTITAGLQLTL